jgi:hypothetical protein
VVLVPGCTFATKRLHDAHECVLYNGQFGGGLSTDAKIGLVEVCVGASLGGCTFGKPTWWSRVTKFSELSLGLPVLQLIYPVDTHMNQRDVNPGYDFHGPTYLSRWAVLGVTAKTYVHPFRNSWAVQTEALENQRVVVDHFGMELGAFAGVVGVRLGFNVAEFTDFMLGWVGLDILGDDVETAESEPPAAKATGTAPEKARQE